MAWMAFVPNSMNKMMPDSLYMPIDRMVMDLLHIPHDSPFIGWCRVQAGRDSMHFDMMNGESMYGSRNMMQFMRNLSCQIHWDNLMSDSVHRHWHPTGMKGWNGSAWVSLGGTRTGSSIVLAGSQTHSAFAFIGASSGLLSVIDRQVNPGDFRLEQNYPNPFNPLTSIHYGIPHQSVVTLVVFNPLGQRVATLVKELQEAGYHTMLDSTGAILRAASISTSCRRAVLFRRRNC
jgi:hypothetical protein